MMTTVIIKTDLRKGDVSGLESNSPSRKYECLKILRTVIYKKIGYSSTELFSGRTWCTR